MFLNIFIFLTLNSHYQEWKILGHKLTTDEYLIACHLFLMFKFLSLDFYDHRIINWEVNINFYFHAKPLRTLMNEDLIIAKTFKSNLTPVCRFPKFVHF
jgi:hypothetical protein